VITTGTQTKFYRSVHFFQTQKSVLGWDLKDRRANLRRMKPPPVRAPPDEGNRGPASGEGPDVEGTTQPRPKATVRGSEKSRVFESGPDSGGDRLRNTNPINHPSYPMAFPRFANQDHPMVLPPMYPKGVLNDRGDVIRNKDRETGIAMDRQPESPVGTKVESNTYDPLTTGVRQPSQAFGDYGPSRPDLSSAAALARPSHVEASKTTKVYRGLSQNHHPGVYEANGVGHNDTGTRMASPLPMTPTQETVRKSRAVLTKQSLTMSNIQGFAPRSRATDNLPLGPKGSDLGKPVPDRQHDSATSAVISSGVVGELWLDTLSLRDWLQAFLTGEIGRASQAVNGNEGSLANL
jgi:hypothetical protein